MDVLLEKVFSEFPIGLEDTYGRDISTIVYICKNRGSGGFYSFAAQGEVVGVRSGTLTGEMEGGHSGLDDLLGDECEKDGQAATCRGPGGRALRYCIIQ